MLSKKKNNQKSGIPHEKFETRFGALAPWGGGGPGGFSRCLKEVEGRNYAGVLKLLGQCPLPAGHDGACSVREAP